MKFDLQHATADPAWTPGILAPSAVTRFARAAEDSGYCSIGFTDHPAPSAKWVHNGGEGSVDPFSALGFCAAVTSRIRLLTWVLVLPYRNPFLTAHQTASLDVLSAGRLIVGVGTGYLRGEFRALGVDFETRREKFDEAVEVLRAAWSGAEITHEGNGFHARATISQPSPHRRPGPPLWVHGNSRWGRLRAARDAEGWVAILATGQLARTMRTAPIDGLDELSRHIEELRTLTVEQGRAEDAVEVVVSGNWPMHDVRRGWDTARLQDDVAELAERGVGRVVLVVCGDDPGAAEDTVLKLGEDLGMGKDFG
ncbi:LLM class F420-dependent oxidoreductase [Amycolatopsis sp.]|uniref:LLM class F420-dependent oxidoreductase n=1 Tax=Amycolatopsis sp. TaxID=37632 RepID=UPI002CC76F5B|nr:LLM class F420-dependent oxidoreductase [Amycolatopsis sp.]HVV08188.1 LLM class F420-dependent oxidoreductase [Amycolatopsis sp.]